MQLFSFLFLRCTHNSLSPAFVRVIITSKFIHLLKKSCLNSQIRLHCIQKKIDGLQSYYGIPKKHTGVSFLGVAPCRIKICLAKSWTPCSNQGCGCAVHKHRQHFSCRLAMSVYLLSYRQSSGGINLAVKHPPLTAMAGGVGDCTWSVGARIQSCLHVAVTSPVVARRARGALRKNDLNYLASLVRICLLQNVLRRIQSCLVNAVFVYSAVWISLQKGLRCTLLLLKESPPPPPPSKFSIIVLIIPAASLRP